MRLWHQLLLPILPYPQLYGQHRECCALRGRGWGRKHSTVNYVFEYGEEFLVAYHFIIRINHTALIHLRHTLKPLGQQTSWLNLSPNTTLRSVVIPYAFMLVLDMTLNCLHQVIFLQNPNANDL